MENKIFKVNIINQFKHFWDVFLYIIGIVFMVLIMVEIKGNEYLIRFVKLAIIPTSLIILPSIILHIQYYFENKSTILMINYQKDFMEYKSPIESIIVSFGQIQRIVMYMTPPAADRRKYPWVPWASYNYTRIILDSGKVINITCFLIDYFEPPIDNSKIEVRKVAFPFIRE